MSRPRKLHVTLVLLLFLGVADGVWEQAEPTLRLLFKLATNKQPEDYATDFFNWVYNRAVGDGNTMPATQTYNILIDLNSLGAVLESAKTGDSKVSGWEVFVEEGYSTLIGKHGDDKYPVVAIKGLYDRGKTYILNLLAGWDLPAGYAMHTKGISIAFSEQYNAIFMDSAGTQTPVQGLSPAKILDRRITDAFLQEVLFSMSHIDLLVVNQLTLQDQIYVTKLQETYEQFHNPQGSVKQRMFLVHNFKDIETPQQLDAIIDTDIIKAFGAVPRVQGFYESKNYYHFVFAREGTAAGKLVNQKSVNLLRNKITACFQGLSVKDIIPTFMAESKKLLERKYLLDTHVEKQEATPNAEHAENSWWGWLVSQKQRLLGVDEGKAARPLDVTVNKPVAIDLEFRLQSGNNKALDSFGSIIRMQSDPGNDFSGVIISPFLEFVEDGTSIQNVNKGPGPVYLPHTTILKRSDQMWEIKMDIPGVIEPKISILNGNILIVEGERLESFETTTVVSNGRPSGRFSHHFELPFFINKELVTSDMDHGVLSIVCKKSES